MSSLVRRLQIRAFKRQGYVRTNFIIARDAAGEQQLQRVPRGGIIIDPKGDPIGTRWPRFSRPALA